MPNGLNAKITISNKLTSIASLNVEKVMNIHTLLLINAEKNIISLLFSRKLFSIKALNNCDIGDKINPKDTYSERNSTLAPLLIKKGISIGPEKELPKVVITPSTILVLNPFENLLYKLKFLDIFQI